MKFLNRLSFSFILIAAAVALLASYVNADDLSGGIQAPDVQAQPVEPQAPKGQTKLPDNAKPTAKGLLIGYIHGEYGTVNLYDNGKGYRWSEIKEKAVYTVYGPGQQRRDVTIELNEPAPIMVNTTRWGKVFTDPRLVVGWIK